MQKDARVLNLGGVPGQTLCDISAKKAPVFSVFFNILFILCFLIRLPYSFPSLGSFVGQPTQKCGSANKQARCLHHWRLPTHPWGGQERQGRERRRKGGGGDSGGLCWGVSGRGLRCGGTRWRRGPSRAASGWPASAGACGAPWPPAARTSRGGRRRPRANCRQRAGQSGNANANAERPMPDPPTPHHHRSPSNAT